MFLLLTSSPRNVWICSLACLATVGGSAFSQDFTTDVANSDPLGLGSFIPVPDAIDLGSGGNMKGDLRYGLDMRAEYNSNFFLTENDEENEFTTNFSPWIRYTSDPEGGAKFYFTAAYEPTLRFYAENSDLNGIDHLGEFTATLQGLKTNLELFGKYSQTSGTDRLTGEFINGTIATGGIRAWRQLGPRTSLNAGWSISMSDYGTSTEDGADIQTLYFGGLWDRTERFSVGPTIRYTNSQSDNTGTRDAWALLVEARYKAGERIWLSASLGPELSSSSNSDSGTSVGLTGQLAAKYVINELWSWSTSVRQATVPSPDVANYVINDVFFTTAIERQLTRGTIACGIDLRQSSYEDEGSSATQPDDEDNFGVFLTYRRTLMSDRVAFEGVTRYTTNDGAVDWSQILVSMEFKVAF